MDKRGMILEGLAEKRLDEATGKDKIFKGNGETFYVVSKNPFSETKEKENYKEVNIAMGTHGVGFINAETGEPITDQKKQARYATIARKEIVKQIGVPDDIEEGVDEAKQRVWYVEYDNGGEAQKAVVNTKDYNKMKSGKLSHIKVTKFEELKDDYAVKLAKADVEAWKKKNGEGQPF